MRCLGFFPVVSSLGPFGTPSPHPKVVGGSGRPGLLAGLVINDIPLPSVGELPALNTAAAWPAPACTRVGKCLRIRFYSI